MILILTQPQDPHADQVAAQLHRRSVPFLRFNPGDFPRSATLSIAFSTGSHMQYVSSAGAEIDLSAITAAWYRRPEPPVPHDEITDEVVRRHIATECGVVLQDVWASLDCRWLPGRPFAVRRAEHKGLQLQTASRLGFELPPTLITNSPEELLDFYQRHNGLIISKKASSTFSATIGQGWIRFTEPVTNRDIIHCQSAIYCPAIFQSYVPKHLELRITVVGDRVFAAEIHSQVTNHTRHDWRHYDRSRTPHVSHTLPRDTEQRCRDLVAELDLHYGAIDMILTPDERYVFLEINPNGQYLWIEEHTGLPITEAICDFLVSESSICSSQRRPTTTHNMGPFNKD